MSVSIRKVSCGLVGRIQVRIGMFGGGRAGMWGRLQYTNTRGFAMNQRFACVPCRFSNAAWPGGASGIGLLGRDA